MGGHFHLWDKSLRSRRSWRRTRSFVTSCKQRLPGQVALRRLLKFLFAAGTAEVKRLSLELRLMFCLAFFHRHAADGIFRIILNQRGAGCRLGGRLRFTGPYLYNLSEDAHSNFLW